jgi:hypothetical protein
MITKINNIYAAFTLGCFFSLIMALGISKLNEPLSVLAATGLVLSTQYSLKYLENHNKSSKVSNIKRS